MASSGVNLFYSRVPLLSGDIGGCPTPWTDTCTGGLASVLAVIWALRRAEDGTRLFLPWLDRTSQFVQVRRLLLLALSLAYVLINRLYRSESVYLTGRGGG